MKQLKYIAIGFLLVLFSGCGGVQFKEVSLQDDFTGEEEKEFKDTGIPALQYQGGLIEDFESGIYSWWTGSNATSSLALEQVDGTMKIKAENVGPNYNPFGRSVPSLDLSGDLVIVVKARAEDNSGKLRIDNEDISGRVANANPPMNTIKVSDEFEKYYYPLKGTFKQSWPTDADVNEQNISTMMFFLNPGGPGYTGTIFIDEISVIKKEDMPEQTYDPGEVGKDSALIGDFEKGIEGWWADDKFSISHYTKEDALKIDVNGAGPDYQPVGSAIDRLNMEHASKLVVWARTEPGDKAPVLRIDVKDPRGHTTNADPVSKEISPDSAYTKYVYDFSGKFQQSYPERAKVDGKRIEQMVWFVNPGGPAYNGTIYIDKVKAVFTGKKEEKEEEKVDVSQPQVIDNFKRPIYSWFSADNIELNKQGQELAVNADKVGKDKESFGRGFPNIDFNNFPIVRMKVKSDKEVDVRVDVKDVDGNATNANPVVKTVSSSDDFQTLYYDFRNKFQQSEPESADVDPSSIMEMEVYLNPGGPDFSGKLNIKSIEAVSPQLMSDDK